MSRGSCDDDVREHVTTCPQCAATVERIREENDLLAELRRAETDAPPSSAGAPKKRPVPAELGSLAGYRVLSEIHRGGQGVVYRAIQEAANRTVALKVLLEGAFATDRQRKRFEREIDLVASLHHPNIITLYDCGTTADGRQYFAMEFVDGVPLDRWAAERGLPAAGPVSETKPAPARRASHASGPRSRAAVRDALRLFSKICDAVNCAHQRGVIHRDLKPGNILVDASDEPHVLDFGLGKELYHDNDPDGATVTRAGEFMGTLAYASPEQALGNPARVDVRSDVYALGVILFQMLTGRFPYNVAAGVRDTLDAIINTEPARPSALVRAIDDELETILLKALAKDRERRYQTAGELGRDLKHYLAGDPIDAKRDSGWYLLRKSLRRYRVPAAILAAFVLLSLGFGITMAVLFGRAAHAERMAQRRLATAESIQQYLKGILASVDPARTQGRDVTVRFMLDEAATRIEEELADQPEVELAVLNTLVETYVALGLYVEAEPHARRALVLRRKVLSADDPELAFQLNRLALVLKLQGRFTEAESLYKQALRLQRAQLGEKNRFVASTLNYYAVLHKDRGKLNEAERMFRRALALRRELLGAEHLDVATTLRNLASVLRERGNFDEAERLLTESLAIRRKRLGNENPDVARAIASLANLHSEKGEYETAESLYLQALTMQRKLLGDEHPHTAYTLYNLAHLLNTRGEYDRAEPLYREALDIHRTALGSDHPAVADTLTGLARLLMARGRLEQAEPMVREVLAIRRKSVPNDSTVIAYSLNNLGVLLTRQRRFAEAEPHLRKALAIYEQQLGDAHPLVAMTLTNLARVLADTGDPLAALPHYRRALALRRERLPAGHWKTANTQLGLGSCLVGLGRFEEAEALLVEAYEKMRVALGTRHGRTTGALQKVIELYVAWNKPDRADEWRAKLPTSSQPAPDEAEAAVKTPAHSGP
ncbi:MAG: serine/threonine protein kinase [Planctomycetes bacterium]|nr:serine/threonine protein kinase [Planctomycetota bacterium]